MFCNPLWDQYLFLVFMYDDKIYLPFKFTKHLIQYLKLNVDIIQTLIGRLQTLFKLAWLLIKKNIILVALFQSRA